jgi:GT2 family glycosyltransferase
MKIKTVKATHRNMISIVIPNLNGKEHLKSCLPSIAVQKADNFKVIVVDNGSTDGSAKFVKDSYPEAEIIRFESNTGFAAAVNAGIVKATEQFDPDYILLLNNDIELEQDFLSIAINTFEEVPECDIIAVKMMNFYKRNIIDDTGNFITKKGGTSYPRGNGQEDTGQFDKPEFIFGACAGAAFYRKEVFEKIGLFDESFFAYLEDIDLAFRAQLAGLKCYYQPKAVCYHKRGGSTISTFKFQMKLNERNAVWLRIKNYPLVLYILYQPLFFLSRLRRLFFIWKNNGFSCFISAVAGYFEGIIKSPSILPKRFSIQKKRQVTVKYIFNLFR